MGERRRLRVEAVQSRQEGERVFHSSVFHITVNSNKKPKTIAQRDEMVKQYSNIIEDVFGDEDYMYESGFVRVLRPGDDLQANIKDISTKFAVEQGKKRGRIHAHITLQITHSTKLRLDPIMLVNTFEETLGYRPYVHVQGTRNNAINLEEYAAKANLASTSTSRTPYNTPVLGRRTKQ